MFTYKYGLLFVWRQIAAAVNKVRPSEPVVNNYRPLR